MDNEKTTIADAEMSCDHISSPEFKEATKEGNELDIDSEAVDFRVVWNKQSFHISFDLEKKMGDLKEHIQRLTGMVS